MNAMIYLYAFPVTLTRRIYLRTNERRVLFIKSSDMPMRNGDTVQLNNTHFSLKIKLQQLVYK